MEIFGVAIISVIVTIGLIAYMKSSAAGGPSATGLADDLIAKGLLFEQQNNLVEARIALERALEAMEASNSSELQQQVTCCVHLGNIYERLGEPKEAAEKFKRVLKNWTALLKANQLAFIDVDFAVTNLDFGRGTLDVAEWYVDNIIVYREQLLPKGHADLIMSYKIGANLLRKSGYTQEADLLETRGEAND